MEMTETRDGLATVYKITITDEEMIRASSGTPSVILTGAQNVKTSMCCKLMVLSGLAGKLEEEKYLAIKAKEREQELKEAIAANDPTSN